MLTDEDCEMAPESQASKRAREAGDTPDQRKTAATSPAQTDGRTSCYLTLKPLGQSMGKENKPAQALAILGAFTKFMIPISSTVPILPRIGQGRHGDHHCFYGFNEVECKLAVSSGTVVSFTFEGTECTYTIEWTREQLPEPSLPPTDFAAAIARQEELLTRDWSISNPSARAEDSIHLVVFAQEGWVFTRIELKQVKHALAKLGLVVISNSRPATKHDNQQIDGTKHETLHFNVMRPIDEVHWPQKLTVKVEFKDEDDKKGYLPCDLAYSILDEGLDKVICTKGSCHAPIDPATGMCPCKRLSSMTSDNYKSMQARKASTSRDARDPALKLPNGASTFFADLGIAKASVMCRHVSAGNCYAAVEGKTCQFRHPPDNDVACIPCKLRRSREGVCSNGAKCKYDHFNQRVPKSLDFGETSSSMTH